jgi:hypothetical protein
VLFASNLDATGDKFAFRRNRERWLPSFRNASDIFQLLRVALSFDPLNAP